MDKTMGREADGLPARAGPGGPPPPRAVVLAGGRGIRLAPFTAILPKPLMPLGEEAILGILLRKLAAEGLIDVPDLVVRLLDAGEHVATSLFDGYWLDIGRHTDYERACEEFVEMRPHLLPGAPAVADATVLPGRGLPLHPPAGTARAG